jgi:hypothetical protein
MSSPEDRAVLLLQRTSELMLECRAVAGQLQKSAGGAESPAEAAERIAYGVLVAALEEGLVTTVRHAIDVLKRFSAPAGSLGEQWLREQENRWRQTGERPWTMMSRLLLDLYTFFHVLRRCGELDTGGWRLATVDELRVRRGFRTVSSAVQA